MKIVYAIADGTGSDTTVNVRRGTISGTTITWGTEATVTVTVTAFANKPTFITRDSNGYVWIAARTQPTAGNYNVAVLRSTNADDVSSWGSLTTIADTSSTTGSVYPTILPLSGGNMYAFWYQDGNINGKKYTGSWGAQESVTTTATKYPSGVVDSSDNVHIVYVDGAGVEYAKRTSSWGVPTTLDSDASSLSPTISIDTSTTNLYAYWVASTNQIKGKQYTSSWTTLTGFDVQTIAKNSLTSPYAYPGAPTVMWAQGSSPQEIKVEQIPEFQDVVAPVLSTIVLVLFIARKRQRGLASRPASQNAASHPGPDGHLKEGDVPRQ